MGSGGSKEQVVGYEYDLGMHIAVCHEIDELCAIEAGEKIAWEGAVTDNTELLINKRDLFGGNRKEGGIYGKLDVLFGKNTQGKNSYLMRNLGPNIPSFRGVFSVVLKKMYLTAMTPYIKPWAFLVKRIPVKYWNPTLADIDNGANAAHILYDIITNTRYGMGYPAARIDETSFTASAQILKNEAFGISLALTGQTTIEDFIAEILKTVSGVLFTDRMTGKFKFKLLRNDYDIANIPHFDESNIVKFDSFERPQYAEMVNEIILVYRPQGARKDSSVSVHNLASIQAQGGVVSQTIRYIGIDNATIAGRVAQRELYQHTTPFAQIRIITNRAAWNLEPGGVFKLSWKEHGIVSVVFRVVSLDLGELTSGEIIINAVEDIFTLPTATYLASPPTKWTNPIGDPAASPHKELKDVPYWDYVTLLPDSALSNMDEFSAYVSMVAQSPSVANLGYRLITKPEGAAEYEAQELGEFTPTAILVDGIGYKDTTDIKIDPLTSLDYVQVGTYAYIGDEVVRIDSLDLTDNKMSVGRGCLDTVVNSHVAGTRVWFNEKFQGIDTTLYTDGERVSGKALTITGTGELLPAADAEDILTVSNRGFLPYPPGKLRIGGSSYPEEIGGNVIVSWAHRDRIQQTARPIISEESGNIGPESGVTYNLKLYVKAENELAREVTGITDTQWEYTDTMESEDVSRLGGGSGDIPTFGQYKVELESERSGFKSYQKHSFSFLRSGSPTGINYQEPDISPSWKEMGTYGGTLSGDAAIVDDYIRLTRAVNSINGTYEVTNASLEDEFLLITEIWAGGGTGADETVCHWQAPGGDLFTVSADEWGNAIRLKINSVEVASNKSSLYNNIDSSTWKDMSIRVTRESTNIRIAVFFDDTAAFEYVHSYTYIAGAVLSWYARTGGANNEHRIRNMRLYNGDRANLYKVGTFSGVAQAAGEAVLLTKNVNATIGRYTITSINLPGAFTLSMKIKAGKGTWADRIFFNWGTLAVREFTVRFDEHLDKVQLRLNGTILKEVSASNLDNFIWRKALIKSEISGTDQTISVTLEGAVILTHTLPYVEDLNHNRILFGGDCGDLNNYHLIKDMKITAS